MDQHANPLTVVLTAGLPGSGKSMLAQAVGRSLGWPVIDKDMLKSVLLEMDVGEAVAAPATYELMWALAKDILVDQQVSLILDSPLSNDRSLDNAHKLAEAANARCEIILCLADRSVRNYRVATRVGLVSQPNRAITVVGDGSDRYQHLPEDILMIRTDCSLTDVVTEAIAYLWSD